MTSASLSDSGRRYLERQASMPVGSLDVPERPDLTVYVIRVGRADQQMAGHRHDCHAVEVWLRVRAEDESVARLLVDGWELGERVDRVQLADVRVVATPGVKAMKIMTDKDQDWEVE